MIYKRVSFEPLWDEKVIREYDDPKHGTHVRFIYHLALDEKRREIESQLFETRQVLMDLLSLHGITYPPIPNMSDEEIVAEAKLIIDRG